MTQLLDYDNCSGREFPCPYCECSYDDGFGTGSYVCMNAVDFGAAKYAKVNGDNCGHCDDGPCMPGCKPPYDHLVPVINKTVPIDWVAHPPHYNKGQYEAIDVIEDAGLGYHCSAALKYLLRCKHKGKELEDISKAVWYLERYLKFRETNDTDTVSDILGEQGNQ